MAYTGKQFDQSVLDMETALDESGGKTDIHEAILNYLRANKDDFLDCFDLDNSLDVEDDDGQEEEYINSGGEPW